MSSYAVDRDKWRALSLFEQMGNIGSEVGRALKAKRAGDKQQLDGAFWRGLDLFDATAEIQTSAARRREILRGREEFARAILGDAEDSSLEDHYARYALVARRCAGR
jgi:hypothetical protein